MSNGPRRCGARRPRRRPATSCCAAAAAWRSTSSTPTGSTTLLDLAAHADALIEGFRPGVMERLGVGPDRVLRPQPQAGVRTDDRLGPGRALCPGRGSRHQLHLARRRAGPLRPGGAGTGPAAQHDRRLRRRRDVPRLRRGVRAARGPAQRRRAGDRRGDGRRLGGADDDVLVVLPARSVRRGRAGHQPARHRRPLLRRLPLRRRRVHLARLDRAAVLRRAARASPASRATSSSPPRWTGPAGRR